VRGRRDVAAFVGYTIPTVGLFLQGLVYLTTPRFMPYHADALGVSWEMLPANHQGFLIGVIKAMGAGSVGVTLALAAMLLIPFRRGEAWARWAVPAIGVVFTALTAYAAFTIDARTPASPPWPQTLGLTTLYVVSALISHWPSRRSRARVPGVLLVMALMCVSPATAQELEPRSYAPSPVGTTFFLVGFGKSEGGILFDPSLDLDNVQADLWIATLGAGHTFDLAGRQARVLAVLPMAWGAIAGNLDAQPQRQDMRGLVDPRFKLSVGLIGSPALTLIQFERVPRRTAVGASVTVVPPLGQYSGRRLVNLGYNRWAFKPELGVSHPIGRLTLDGYAGVWLFTTNDSFYPGDVRKSQDAVLSVQSHASYPLTDRIWLAVDATWFAGGETQVDRVLNPDLQRNARLV
jgi:ABC-type Mn2+/Zn2+ transport system permease subunit